MADLFEPSGRKRKSSAERKSSADRKRKARKGSVMVAGSSRKKEFLSPVAELDYIVASGSTRKIHPELIDRPSDISLSKV